MNNDPIALAREYARRCRYTIQCNPNDEAVPQWAAQATVLDTLAADLEAMSARQGGEPDVEIAPSGPWYCEYEEHGEYRRGWRIVERHSARAFVIPAPDYSEREALAICVALNGMVGTR